MAANAFTTGFDAKSDKKKQQDDDDDSKQKGGGASGGFQRGWDAAGDRAKGKNTVRKGKSRDGGSGGLGGLLGGGIIPVLQKVIGSYRHGGRVKKTGLYHLHKGENVIPAGKRRASKASHKRTVVKA
jgi:hypothetical protein